MPHVLLIVLTFLLVGQALSASGFINCQCSPTNTTGLATVAINFMNASLTEMNKGNPLAPGAIGADLGISAARKVMQNCASNYSVAACIDADAHLRGKHKISICKFNEKSGLNLDDDNLPLPVCSGGTLVTAGKKMNEGCVAVEHLHGLAVQYSRPLKREVLCWQGFCATPNHGLFLRGTYTSLKRVCLEEECTREKRHVNNLRVFAHTRVKIDSEIEITPYDYRFPWLFTWIVQAISEVLWLLLMSIGIVFAILFYFTIRYVIQKHEINLPEKAEQLAQKTK